MRFFRHALEMSFTVTKKASLSCKQTPLSWRVCDKHDSMPCPDGSSKNHSVWPPGFWMHVSSTCYTCAVWPLLNAEWGGVCLYTSRFPLQAGFGSAGTVSIACGSGYCRDVSVISLPLCTPVWNWIWDDRVAKWSPLSTVHFFLLYATLTELETILKLLLGSMQYVKKSN